MEEILCLFGVVVFTITTVSQVMIPVMFKKPTFPLFRRESQLNKEKAEIERRKEEAKERLRLAELEKETVELELKADIARNSILEDQLIEDQDAYESKQTQKQ